MYFLKFTSQQTKKRRRLPSDLEPTPVIIGDFTGVTVFPVTDSGATITWSEVPNATRYDLQYRRLNEIVWTYISNTSLSAVLTNLDSSQIYIFVIVATFESQTATYLGQFETLAEAVDPPDPDPPEPEPPTPDPPVTSIFRASDSLVLPSASSIATSNRITGGMSIAQINGVINAASGTPASPRWVEIVDIADYSRGWVFNQPYVRVFSRSITLNGLAGFPRIRLGTSTQAIQFNTSDCAIIGVETNGNSNSINQSHGVWSVGHNRNIVQDCVFHHEQWGGFVIVDCSEWRVYNCVSYSNQDHLATGSGNRNGDEADGFKTLTNAGLANTRGWHIFDSCIASDCSDDGFDLFRSRTNIIRNCYAYGHGYGTEGDGENFKIAYDTAIINSVSGRPRTGQTMGLRIGFDLDGRNSSDPAPYGNSLTRCTGVNSVAHVAWSSTGSGHSYLDCAIHGSVSRGSASVTNCFSNGSLPGGALALSDFVRTDNPPVGVPLRQAVEAGHYILRTDTAAYIAGASARWVA